MSCLRGGIYHFLFAAAGAVVSLHWWLAFLPLSCIFSFLQGSKVYNH